MLSITNQQVMDGLLGKLPTDQEGVFLASCFSSDENAEKFEIIRENLIENYLVGRLSPDDQTRFENYFLLNPHHRELFEFAGTVRNSLQSNRQLEQLANEKGLKKTFLVSSLLIPAGGLAMLLIGAFAAWQIFLFNSNKQIVQTPEKSENTNSRTKPIFSADEPNSNSPGGAKNSIIAFTLPTTNRGWQSSELKIDNQIKEIQLIAPKPAIEFSIYQVKLEKDNKLLWQKEFETFESYETDKIKVNIPSDKFQKGELRFVIFGKNTNGKFEEIKDSERFFSVSK